MPDLKVGYDYHMAEVATQLADHRWFAFCDACGWQGPKRDSKAAADDDAAAHDVAENEGITG